MSMLNPVNEITGLLNNPDAIEFVDVMEVIDSSYHFTETSFNNGNQHNAAGENNGSCKVFAFARLHSLTAQQTLQLFGEHYRKVLATPEEQDHQNIRKFIAAGWDGLTFNGEPLSPK